MSEMTTPYPLPPLQNLWAAEGVMWTHTGGAQLVRVGMWELNCATVA